MISSCVSCQAMFTPPVFFFPSVLHVLKLKLFWILIQRTIDTLMATIVEERNILRLWFTAWMVVAAKEASYCEVTALHYDATYRVFVLSNISCIVSGESNLFLSLLCSSWWVLTLTTSKLPSLHRSFAFCLPALARGYPHEQKIWVDVSANIYNLCFDSVEIWRSGRLIAGNNGGSFSDLQI